jgi:hypothetical protein
MKWINRKERIYVFLTLALVIAGIACIILQPKYNEHFISEPDHSRSFRVLAEKNEKDSLVIRVDGLSTANYGLRLDIYRLGKERKTLQRSYSETIKIPAGEIHAAFKRKLVKDFSTAYLTYIPEQAKNIQGQIVLQTSFF